jgi:hypothetical protein
MNETVTDQTKTRSDGRRTWRELLISDGVLGSLVVLFTVATAFAAYQASTADIRAGDLDVNAQNNLILGVASYQESNLILMDDSVAFAAYRLLKESDPDAAAGLLETASPELMAGLSRPGGPFDEQYEDVLYQEARDLLAESQALQEEGNLADDQALKFQEAAFILAITAWASLFDTRPQLRLVFTLLALPCLLIGLVLVAVSVTG